MDELIEQIARLAKEPVDVSHELAAKMRKGAVSEHQQLRGRRKASLSTLACRYENFELGKYNKVHRIKLSERLLQTLERNDIERPKVLMKKAQVFRELSENIDQVKLIRDEAVRLLRCKNN